MAINYNQAKKLKEQAEKAVKKYGDFKYNKQGAYNSAMDAILNRKAFSYDLNGDALYQQYKDMYTAQGKQAMVDTMGQAAALTGGYGNSYAATAGNQAYQGYLQQLNGVVPELYSLALSAYNAEGDRLNNNFSVLSSDRNTQYGEWNDKYNRLLTDRGYYSDNYNTAYAQKMARSSGGGGSRRYGGSGGELSTSAKKDIYSTLNKYLGRKDANGKIGANYEIAKHLDYFQKVYGLSDAMVDKLYQEYSYDMPVENKTKKTSSTGKLIGQPKKKK